MRSDHAKRKVPKYEHKTKGNSYRKKKMKRSRDERHTQTHGSLGATFRSISVWQSYQLGCLSLCICIR